MNEQAANALPGLSLMPSAANLHLADCRLRPRPIMILSRCLHMRFNPLRQDDVAKFMENENGRKKSLFTGVFVWRRYRPSFEFEQRGDNGLSFRYPCRFAAVKAEPFSMINFTLFLNQDKKKIKVALDIISGHFRDVLIYKETKKSQMLINQDVNGFCWFGSRSFIRRANSSEY